jgi:hypothetical protein
MVVQFGANVPVSFCAELYFVFREIVIVLCSRGYQGSERSVTWYHVNSLTPELNPSAQRCLTRFFTGDFAS